jgi:hypothetical protein
MSLPGDGFDDGGNEFGNNNETEDETVFAKMKMTEKQYGKYDSITKYEIIAINNYCRDSLWRRAKFINDRQLGDEFNKICDDEEIAHENRNHKYVDIILLIQNNMNYRRSYSTKRMRELMLGKNYTLILGFAAFKHSNDLQKFFFECKQN